MLSKAKAKYVRMSPRKVRLVMELIKGKTVEDANAILGTVNKRASGPIKKVIDSAFANVNFDRQAKLLEKDVVISKLEAGGGPMLTRYRAATMGRAAPIKHRTVHIGVELDVAAVETKTENKQSESK
ncbi:MAG: 50S ribosomal protein L22 [Candidatus Omnitrophica bacterium]|nr:50S ribosomal protein L22 [Candidatus Omnitrophota bacterium]MBU1784425.1 50S ribosomal protein L22 [Candidatus Omnitrophota bacterium]MBU1851628.1 50S ribosomal protein L22 [Candidatus Omnitrophota bacterium]